MDKIHDFEVKSKSLDKSNATENVSADSTDDRISMSPPTFQLKAEKSNGEAEEKEESVSVEPTYQFAAEGSEPPSDNAPNDDGASTSKPNNTGLPNQLKSGVENLSGFSLDDVNVHYNSSKPAQLQAHAYAQGSDIHLGPGQERHLPHEAWHVVQQKQGRVQATTQMKGIGVNDDSGLEKEADVMGAKAMQMKVSEPFNLEASSGQSKAIQRKPVKGDGSDYHDSIHADLRLVLQNEDDDKIVFTCDYQGVSHTIHWVKSKKRYRAPGADKGSRRLPNVLKSMHNDGLIAKGLHMPHVFELESEADVDSSQQNQIDIFEGLDEAFAASDVTTGNKGVLNLILTMKPEGLDLDIADGIRTGGAMNPFEGAIGGELKNKMKRLAMDVLRGSGQLEYLEANKETLISDDWSVLIDLDFYYLRNKSQTNFHMDTDGETLFTNLIFNQFTDKLRFGPEIITDLSYLSDDKHAELDTKVGGPDQFPKKISDDVIYTRHRKPDTGGDIKSYGGPIDALSVATFTDATSLHSSPQGSSRYGAALNDPWVPEISESYSANTKDISKGLSAMGLPFSPDKKLVKAEIEKIIAAATNAKEIAEAKTFKNKKNIRRIDAVLRHLMLMLRHANLGKTAKVYQETLQIPLPVETMDRALDQLLEDPEMADDIRAMKASTERRTFIRMWVQIMKTSSMEFNADVHAITDGLSTKIDDIATEENKLSIISNYIDGELKLNQTVKKLKNRASATILVRGKVALDPAKLDLLSILPKLEHFLVTNATEDLMLASHIRSVSRAKGYLAELAAMLN